MNSTEDKKMDANVSKMEASERNNFRKSSKRYVIWQNVRRATFKSLFVFFINFLQ